MTWSLTEPPLGALQRDPAVSVDAALRTKRQRRGGPKPRRAVRCAACGSEVTSPDQRTTVQGAHRHRFMNPSGYVYDIACYGEAPGCQAVGEPTLEFTWFLGFAWSFAVCKGCSMYLGWRYESEGAGFYGLIANRLSDAPDEPEDPNAPVP